MEELDKKESSSDEDSDNNGGNIEISWDINFENEKKFWKEFCLQNLTYVPIIFPLCKQNTFRANERKIRKDIINPFYLQCNNKSCKKKEI